MDVVRVGVRPLHTLFSIVPEAEKWRDVTGKKAKVLGSSGKRSENY